MIRILQKERIKNQQVKVVITKFFFKLKSIKIFYFHNYKIKLFKFNVCLKLIYKKKNTQSIPKIKAKIADYPFLTKHISSKT